MKNSVKTVVRKDQLTAGGKARIEFVIYFKGKQCRISSGKNIEPKYWNSDLECVDKKSPEASEINKQLAEKVANYDKFVKTKEVLNEKISLDDLKLILKGQPLEKKLAPQKKKYPTISEAFNSYIANTEVKQATVTNYKVTKTIVNDFCRKKYSKALTVNDIDFNFLEKFKKYLSTERERRNNKNTIAKRLKILRTIVLYADNQGYIEKNPFKGYKIEQGKPREVALSANEYSKMCKVQLPTNSCNSMKLTKNIFVFCCETGLRYSDALDLRWEHIDENMKSMSKIQVKTEQKVFVPISNQAKAILVMYQNKHKDIKGYVFPRIDNQVMNRYLKEISKIADIDKNVTTHVARHTFGTRLGASGVVSAFNICKLMGHSDLEMTMRYINSSKEDLTKAMTQVWGQKNMANP